MTPTLTTKTKAAKDGDLEAAQSTALVRALNALAREWSECADRADDPEVEDMRRRSTAQLRFVAVLTASGPGYFELGIAWAIAGRRMLDAANLADMDAVYESRRLRRGVL